MAEGRPASSNLVALVILVLVVAASACGPPPEPKPRPAAPVKVNKVSLAEVGLDAGSMDRSMDPCVNFYLFACGGWDKNAEYPAHRAATHPDDPRDARDDALRSLLEKAAESPGQAEPLASIGTFYAACMDEPSVEVLGLATIRSTLTLLDRMRLPGSLAPPLEQVLATLHAIDVPALFELSVRPDPEGGNGVLVIEQAGLGLPSRAYYMSEAKAIVQLREQYKSHVARMLTMIGGFGVQAEQGARDVLDIESGLAVLMEAALEPRQAAMEKVAASEMRSASLDLSAYLTARELPVQPLAVTSKAYLRGVHKLLETTPKSALAHYFKWMLAHHLASALGSRFVEEQHTLAALTEGQRDAPPRWRQCMDAAVDAFGPALAQRYWAGTHDSGSVAGVADLVTQMREQVAAGVAGAAWMAPPDRAAAQASLKRLDALVGVPASWPPAGPLSVAPRSHTANVLAARTARVRSLLAGAGKPVDRSAWPDGALEPELGYLPGRHQLTLSAMLLQPPIYAPKASVAAKMGSLGSWLARAMLRTVDEHGATFDGQGRRSPGWSKATKDGFGQRAQCLAEQFADDELRPGVKLDAERTARENAVELGALQLAYRAYRKQRGAATERFVADGHNEDQQFFLAYAQSQCTKYAWRTERVRAATERQTQADIRVNGALRNHSAFAEAFLCQGGVAMVPKQRCTVW